MYNVSDKRNYFKYLLFLFFYYLLLQHFINIFLKLFKLCHKNSVHEKKELLVFKWPLSAETNYITYIFISYTLCYKINYYFTFLYNFLGKS